MASNGARPAGYAESATSLVRIRRSALEVIRGDALARAPVEACGLLIGEEDRACRRILRAVPVENAWGEAPRARYLIPASELRRGEATAAREGLLVVGTYHAHPEGSAEPSAFDRRHAWPWYTYLIIPSAGDVRAWRLEEDRSAFREEELVITEDE